MTGRLEPLTSFSPPGCLVLFSFLFPHSSLPPPCPPALPPSFPPHPRTAEPFRKSEVEAEQENGPAQSPPSRLGLAVNPFLGWLALSRLAVGLKGRGEGKEVAWPLSLVVPGHPLNNFWADLEQLARVPPPPLRYWGPRELPENGEESGDGPGSSIYKSLNFQAEDNALLVSQTTSPLLTSIPSSLQSGSPGE